MSTPGSQEPIAIVGSGCRFPGGAHSPSKLWDLMINKRDALKTIDHNRFNPKGFYHSNGERHGNINITKAYILEQDPKVFDASFFGINPKEAEAIDPQHRILLETVYEAIESGGFSLETMRGSETAVYVGAMTGDYVELLLRNPTHLPKYVATGTASSILSNRISYFYDWKGPSVTMDTACSSSLVAVHHGVQSLRSGEANMVMAGGTNLILSADFMNGECNLHMLSADSRSHMWDSRANGYARGEGFAAVLLKRLSDAVRDGDNIQCVIRETGCNSDGRTQGITLPNPDAQSKLIRDVYRRAGLDVLKNKDKPQYFEAHGTGTPAGDPLEATGIRDAFFPLGKEPPNAEDGTLLVGGVKTVVGHTEGTAGLAGLIKVAESIRRGVIPPNQLFEKLNPKLIPLTTNLKVVTEETPWPQVAANAPRRASVNCFGFGGTNTHAIVESYEPEPASIPKNPDVSVASKLAVPIVLSAHSERSLAAMVSDYYSFIENNSSLSLNDLAWTLQSRRSEFGVKAHFSGPTREELLVKMKAALVKAEENPAQIGQRKNSRPSKPRIFGVFTGQGAQWANMGRDLILASSMARSTIESMDKTLQGMADGPSWTLMDKLTSKDPVHSLDEAELSQPICTAVQVMVINILQSAGVEFAAVVGHSSGEISAAYAAGVINATEAIKIAYYRGFHSKLSLGRTGQKGAMLAAGLSFDDATEFCSRSEIAGRVEVAASNAPQSVTLSGDIDAVQTAKKLLDKDSTFNRMLKVNKAYHSHHMEPCSQPYIASLKSENIQPRYPRDGCVWVSSVFGDDIKDCASLEELASTYWNDNMLKPVLFSMAVEQHMNISSDFDMAIEVGPHPALKGPALQTIKAVTDSSLPYGSTLNRGTNDVAALSGTFGFLMEHQTSATLKLDTYIKSMQSDVVPRLLTGLPTYSWDHTQKFWAESRYSKNYRLKDKPRHDLLGERIPDDLETDMRYRNTVRVTETPWLAGHKIGGQIVYPAAAYLVMALEACKDLADPSQIKMVELLDVEISRALPLEEDDKGTDTMFSMKKTSEKTVHGEKTIEADFSCFSCAGVEADNWDLNTRGSLRLRLGEVPALPKRNNGPLVLNNLNVTTFYDHLKSIGFEYTGLFRRLDTIERRMDRATTTAIEYPEDVEMPAMIHPALLDASFQSIFAALQYPADGIMTAPLVPTNIKCIRIVAGQKPAQERQIAIESTITARTGGDIIADIEMYDATTSEGTLTVEGLYCTTLDKPNPRNDTELYCQNVLKADLSTQALDTEIAHESKLPQLDLIHLCERLSFMYLQQIHAALQKQGPPPYGPHHQRIFDWADSLLPVVQSGQHPIITESWYSEDSKTLLEEAEKHSDVVDIQAIHAIGKSFLAAVDEKKDVQDHGLSADLAQSYLDLGLGKAQANAALASTVNQIAHRYAGMRVLEINAGSTALTKEILAGETNTFKGYTVARKGYEATPDQKIDPYFEEHKVKFQALDLEGDLEAQGYDNVVYDVVVVANTLYAASKQADAVANIRSLVKPGGYLLLLESTGDLESTKFVQMGLPKYWPSDDLTHRYEPPTSVSQWNFILEDNGFSGVDQVTNGAGKDLRQTFSVMLSQAVSEEIQFLRNPLSPPRLELSIGSICIIGRNQRRNADVTSYLLRSFRGLDTDLPKITYLDRIEDVLEHTESISSVIYLQDLDEPIWKTLSDDTLRSFKKLLGEVRHFLWVTSGSRLENAYASMSVGMGRGLQAEYGHIRLQLVDVDPKSLRNSNHLLAEAAMRLIGYESIKGQEPDMLWTLEPELLIEKGGIMIPRVIADDEMNYRLNAKRRSIKKTIQSSGSQIAVEAVNNAYTLSEVEQPTASSSEAIVRVQQVLLSTVKASGSVTSHIAIGEIAQGNSTFSAGTKVLAFANKVSSTISVPKTHLFHIPPKIETNAHLLQAVVAVLVADISLSRLRPGSTVLLLASDEPLAKAYERRAQDQGHTFVRASSEPSSESGVVHIDAFAPLRKTRAQLPATVDLFVNFGARGVLDSCLDKTTTIVNIDDVLSESFATASGAIPKELSTLVEAAQGLAPHFIRDVSAAPIAALSDISSDSSIRPRLAVLDFANEDNVQIDIAPVDTKKLFRQDRTYLLVGCTGGLGQSLCRWMVANGAKHLALTSRNAKSVNKTWLEEMRTMGGNPQIFETDVINYDALVKTHGEINSKMPPIAGVANAAMVLSDCLFDDISHKDFSTVLRPKVEGTDNLNRLFNGPGLDFFILFSSFSTTVGNRGQTNYLAANMYMATVAAQRRKRGLAASVMHIGMVLGLGVVFQTGLYESTMKKLNLMPVSEPAFLDMFAQSIIVGKPDSTHANDFVTGLGRLSQRPDAPRPFYANNVRFSHHILNDEAEGSSEVGGDGLTPSQRMAAAKSLEDLTEIIIDIFIGKLERVLQSSRDQIHPSQGLIALGTDSLMAVEIRSWFFSDISVDIPILKLLGGASIADICKEAASLRPAIAPTVEESVPVVKPSSPTKAEQKPTSPKKKPAPKRPDPSKRSSTPALESRKSSVSAMSSPVLTATGASTPQRKMSTGATTPNLSGQSGNATPFTTPSVSSDDEHDLGFKWDKIHSNKPKTYPTEVAGLTLDLERVGRMSFSQERLWFLRSYLNDPTTYNITLTFKLTGPINVAAMERAFKMNIERHEILRTAFYTNLMTGEAQQGVIAESPFELEKGNITDDSQVEEEYQKIAKRVYDLERGDTLAAKLLKKDDNSGYLIVGYHHIALDGTTSLLFMRDFAMFYTGAKLERSKFQYIDYAVKQRQLVKTEGASDIAYWKSEFPDSPAVIPFFDFGSVKIRKPLVEYKIRKLELELDADTTASLKTASQKMKVTGFHLHLATLQVLLHRMLKINDVCIGITDANKNDSDHFDTLGFFVNLVPIRSRIDGKQSFAGIAQKARDKTFQALEHSQLPFDVLLNELNIAKTTDTTPLFQVLLNYKMGSERTLSLGETQADAIKVEDASNPYDLQFNVEVDPNGKTLITASTQAHLYSDGDLSTIVRVYTNLLQALASKPSLPVANHKLATSQDIDDALEVGKGPRVNFDQSITVSKLFDSAVEARSTNVAVIDNVGGVLTWNQMAARVHALSTHLIRIGVKANSFVGVYADPSVNSVCYWLAILRVGARYVPLDVSNPTERLRLIVADCKPACIICDKNTAKVASELEATNCRIITLADLEGHRPQFVRDVSKPESIACAIYTSGTTGTPKGCLLSNGNLVSHILGVNQTYGLQQETVLQITNLGFDLSLAQMLQFLASQGKLVVANSQSRNDPAELLRLMVQHEITFTIVTPSVYSILLQQGSDKLKNCSKWRTAISCGEALTGPVVKGFQGLKLPSLRLINSCGPTEITIINSAWEIPLADPNASDFVMTVGSSLPNYSTYILGADGQPQPLGFPGEMVCGGASISQGYLGKKELTATQWINDPFASKEDQAKGWDRMYRTGDKAKLLPNGQFVFLGRIEGSQQIKLRGVRIELDDITNTIIRHVGAEVKEAAVALRGEGDLATLVAFVVLGVDAPKGGLDEWTKNVISGLPLPSTMKPSRIVVVPSLPRTTNGKIDRRALTTMPLSHSEEKAPVTEDLTKTEITLKTMWSNMLSSGAPTAPIRKTTDFFQAGGNSMLLVGIQARIRQDFGIDIPLFKFFQNNKLADMASMIEASAPQQPDSKVDWMQVTSLGKEMVPTTNTKNLKPVMDTGLEILLTGSTGFLGAKILEELVADDRVTAIHCVAIRNNNRSVSRDLASSSSKIIKYYGDLAADRLGMSEEAFEDLAQNVDRIIHNGADVSFLKAYSSLEQTNLGSTKTLARLALDRKIPFHFVSTAGVAQFYPSDELPENFLPTDITPPADIVVSGATLGYAASKWASETYLRRCAEDLGLPVCVHRPCNILGAGAEDVNLTANVIDYTLRIGAAPETPNLKGHMQFVSVEEVGSGVVDSLFSGRAGARVVHHCSEEKAEMANLRGFLEIKYNRRLSSLSLMEWIEQAKEKGLPGQAATMMSEVLRQTDGPVQMKTLTPRSKRLSTALTAWFQESQTSPRSPSFPRSPRSPTFVRR